MRSFENARNGISKVFASAILEIVSSIAVGATLTLSSKISSAVFLALFGVSFIASFVAFILNLVGLKQAGKDDTYLKDAFVLSILGIISSIAGAIFGTFTENAMCVSVASALNIFNDILEIGVVVLVCLGLSRLLTYRDEDKLANSGNTTAWFFSMTFIIAALINLISSIFKVQDNLVTSIVVAILAILYMVLVVVAYIRYLVFLGKAKGHLA